MPTSLADLLPLLASLNRDRGTTVPLCDIADALGLSPWHAQRTFARFVGESPKQYRLRLRVEYAAALLATRDDSILGIALAVGFDSHAGFTRAFRRHFGVPPRVYREHVTLADDVDRHAAVLARVGPCVHLFRARLEAPNEGDDVTYEITQRSLDETPILFIARRVEHRDLADTLGEVLPAVFTYASEAGIAMAGPPLVRYPEWSAAYATIEAGLPIATVPSPAPDRDGIAVGLLPAGEAAVTTHVGPYDGLREAYAALERWIVEHDRTPGGHPWEVYVTDPGEVPDPADWRTEVVWPLQA